MDGGGDRKLIVRLVTSVLEGVVLLQEGCLVVGITTLPLLDTKEEQ